MAMGEGAPSAHASIPVESEAHPPKIPNDAGAAFVLESRGTWWHAGFHLTTAIVGPTMLTLPYALRGMGWAPGLASLTAVALVTFYAYLLMARVLDHCEEHRRRRHIRFRELAADVLGPGWISHFVVCLQTAINTGIGIGCVLLAGECLKVIHFLHLTRDHINRATLCYFDTFE